jgi:hypothetical protein
VPAIPGLQWFIHAAKATAIIFAGAIMNGWAQKKKTDQAKER